MNIPSSYFAFLSAFLFIIGTLGVLLRRNVLISLMSIELMLNAVNLSFVAFSWHWGALDGQVFVLLVMAVAAAEVAIGLGIVIGIFRRRGTTDIDALDEMKW